MHLEEFLPWITTGSEMALVYVLWHDRQQYKDTQRNIRDRVEVNLEILNLRYNQQPVYGLQDIIDSISDIIDRIRTPEPYQKAMSIVSGNEILIAGSTQTGKKALALEIARQAGIQRAIVVYNPRDAEALARAKKLINASPNRARRLWRSVCQKVTQHQPKTTLLLLPGLDEEINGQKNEAWRDQLEALIETASSKPHILVVGTTTHYHSTNDVASWFGTVIEFPDPDSPEWQVMVNAIAGGFLEATQKSGYTLHDITSSKFITDMLARKPTPAEIQDIFVHCQTQAIYLWRQEPSRTLALTPAILDRAIRRVIRPEPSPPSTSRHVTPTG